MTTPTERIDLAAARLGGQALLCSDDFFAPMSNLNQPGRGVFIADRYTERGKWMDGWESRRRRGPGYDWCILRLGAPGRVRALDVDTNHFTGNYPEHCSVDAIELSQEPPLEALSQQAWWPLLPLRTLSGGSQHLFEVQDPRRVTHVRLNIFPDGGVARLRVYGEVQPDWAALGAAGEVDLAAAVHGGEALLCSDMYFSHRNNLLMPGRGVNMGDGWETRRRRGPGWDWLILRLGRRGRLRRVEVDTAHFKGNFPESCSLEVVDLEALGELPPDFLGSRSLPWRELLPRTRLSADSVHTFELSQESGPVTHARLNIFPDGGVSRLRLWGQPL